MGKILIADDEPLSRILLEKRLIAAGYEVIIAENGTSAWEILVSQDAPELAIVDWIMPGMDGVELCRRLRARESERYVYVILLTARDRTADLVIGLEAGADDYVTKPFDWEELHTRLRTGFRMNQLQAERAAKVEELERALAHVNTLEGLLPICMHCKSIRDDSNAWHRIESYIEKHSNALFTHSLCATCLNKHYPAYANEPLPE